MDDVPVKPPQNEVGTERGWGGPRVYETRAVAQAGDKATGAPIEAHHERRHPPKRGTDQRVTRGGLPREAIDAQGRRRLRAAHRKRPEEPIKARARSGCASGASRGQAGNASDRVWGISPTEEGRQEQSRCRGVSSR